MALVVESESESDSSSSSEEEIEVEIRPKSPKKKVKPAPKIKVPKVSKQEFDELKAKFEEFSKPKVEPAVEKPKKEITPVVSGLSF